MVVTIWLESSGGFRARIRRTSDIGETGQDVSAATEPEEVFATVRAWLEEVVGRAVADPSLEGESRPNGEETTR